MITIEEIDKNLLYSPAAEEGDTRPADIYSFFPYEYQEKTQELNDYVKTLNDDHRLAINYSKINFFDHDFVSVWKRNNKIVGFSTGYSCDHYPTNSVRILNRFYHNKQTSRVRFTREVLRPATFHCIQQQLIMASKLSFDNAFMSREPRTNKFFKMFTKALNARSAFKWEFKEGPFLVVANSEHNSKAWQSISVAKLNDNNFWEEWNETK